MLHKLINQVGISHHDGDTQRPQVQTIVDVVQIQETMTEPFTAKYQSNGVNVVLQTCDVKNRVAMSVHEAMSRLKLA